MSSTSWRQCKYSSVLFVIKLKVKERITVGNAISVSKEWTIIVPGLTIA
jgi:hypothetical protein